MSSAGIPPSQQPGVIRSIAAVASGAALPPRQSFVRRVLHTILRAQWLVGGACAVVAIAYPQVEVYGCFFGAFFNAFLAKLLKRLIGQQRPMFAAPKLPTVPAPSSAAGVGATATHIVEEAASKVAAAAVDAAVFAADTLDISHAPPEPLLHALPHPQLSEKHLGHGMPSSHAMSLFYLATFLTLAAFDPTNGQPVVNSSGELQPPHPFITLARTWLPSWFIVSWSSGWARPILAVALYTLVALECWTRIRRRLHSWQQITVGAILGTMVATLHSRVVMPMVREASKDVPPLAERSAQFKIVTVACFSVLAALTLERNTQRLAMRVVSAVWRRLGGPAAVAQARNNVRNDVAQAKQVMRNAR